MISRDNLPTYETTRTSEVERDAGSRSYLLWLKNYRGRIGDQFFFEDGSSATINDIAHRAFGIGLNRFEAESSEDFMLFFVDLLGNKRVCASFLPYNGFQEFLAKKDFELFAGVLEVELDLLKAKQKDPGEIAKRASVRIWNREQELLDNISSIKNQLQTLLRHGLITREELELKHPADLLKSRSFYKCLIIIGAINQIREGKEKAEQDLYELISLAENGEFDALLKKMQDGKRFLDSLNLAGWSFAYYEFIYTRSAEQNKWWDTAFAQICKAKALAEPVCGTNCKHEVIVSLSAKEVSKPPEVKSTVLIKPDPESLACVETETVLRINSYDIKENPWEELERRVLLFKPQAAEFSRQNISLLFEIFPMMREPEAIVRKIAHTAFDSRLTRNDACELVYESLMYVKSSMSESSYRSFLRDCTRGDYSLDKLVSNSSALDEQIKKITDELSNGYSNPWRERAGTKLTLQTSGPSGPKYAITGARIPRVTGEGAYEGYHHAAASIRFGDKFHGKLLEGEFHNDNGMGRR